MTLWQLDLMIHHASVAGACDLAAGSSGAQRKAVRWNSHPRRRSPDKGLIVNVTFEQAREILAENLANDGYSGRVAAWGWENDELFVLAIDNTSAADSAQCSGDDDGGGDDYDGDDGDDDLTSDDFPEADGWGTPEDLQAVREHMRLVPRGWDPWEGRPEKVPVVEKATGRLRWESPAGLGDPVAPNLRPIGEVPESQRWRDRGGTVLSLDELRDIWANDIGSIRSKRAQSHQDGMTDEEFEDDHSLGAWLYEKLLKGTYRPAEDDGDEVLPDR